jgi:hypothetical protein
MQTQDEFRNRFINAIRNVVADPKFTETTEGDVAIKIGMRASVLSRIKSHHGMPTPEQILLLCSEFNIAPDYLLLGIGEVFRSHQLSVGQRLERLEDEIIKLKRIKIPAAITG